MAVKIWGAGSTGGTDNAWDTATNWDNDTLPVNGDDVLFDGSTNNNIFYGPSSPVTLNSLVATSSCTHQLGMRDAAITITNELTNASPVGYLDINVIFSGVSIINCNTTPNLIQLAGNSTVAAGTYVLGGPAAEFGISSLGNYSLTFLGTSTLSGYVSFNLMAAPVVSPYYLTITSSDELFLNNLNMTNNFLLTYSEVYFESTNGTHLYWNNPIDLRSDGNGQNKQPIEFRNIKTFELLNFNVYGLNSFIFKFGYDCTAQISNSVILQYEDPNSPYPSTIFDCNNKNIVFEVVNGSKIYFVSEGLINFGSSLVQTERLSGIILTNINLAGICSWNIRDSSSVRGIIMSAAATVERYFSYNSISYGGSSVAKEINFFDNSYFSGTLGASNPSQVKFYDKSQIKGMLFIGSVNEMIGEAQIQYGDLSLVTSLFLNSYKASF